MRAKLVVARDSGGTHLVSVAGDGPKHRWDTWKVEASGKVHGPNLLGNWVRFNPSDYAELPAAGPFPPAVEALIARISPG